MGGDRQQVDVCKILLLHVGYKLIGQLIPIERSMIVVVATPPGHGVHFVDTDGRMVGVSLVPGVHPMLIVPLERFRLRHNGCVTWRGLSLRSEERRVGKECRDRWASYC